jgi:hypothetical protein
MGHLYFKLVFNNDPEFNQLGLSVVIFTIISNRHKKNLKGIKVIHLDNKQGI